MTTAEVTFIITNDMTYFSSNFDKNNITDEQLCSLAQQGDRLAEEYLAEQCSGLVKSCARPYFLAGAESEDVIQEGMIGLLKAIRSYDESSGIPFRAYAHTCVLNRIYSAVRSASSGKHRALNDSESISDETLQLNKLSDHSDPETMLIATEEQRESMDKLLEQLSDFEKDVLELFLHGLSYKAMAEELDKPAKSVDNAVQRIRRKAAGIRRQQ